MWIVITHYMSISPVTVNNKFKMINCYIRRWYVLYVICTVIVHVYLTYLSTGRYISNIGLDVLASIFYRFLLLFVTVSMIITIFAGFYYREFLARSFEQINEIDKNLKKSGTIPSYQTVKKIATGTWISIFVIWCFRSYTTVMFYDSFSPTQLYHFPSILYFVNIFYFTLLTLVIFKKFKEINLSLVLLQENFVGKYLCACTVCMITLG